MEGYQLYNPLSIVFFYKYRNKKPESLAHEEEAKTAFIANDFSICYNDSR
jgi:hypothetical protein